MTDKAKVFMSGRSQAVRIPKAYRLDTNEVTIERDGDALILRPVRDESFVELLDQIDANIAAHPDDPFPEPDRRTWGEDPTEGLFE